MGDESAVAQFAQNLHQIVRRNRFDFGQFLDVREPSFAVVPSQLRKHSAGIIDLDRKFHDVSNLHCHLWLAT